MAHFDWLIKMCFQIDWLLQNNAQDTASKYYNFNIQSMEIIIVYMKLKTNLDDVLTHSLLEILPKNAFWS